MKEQIFSSLEQPQEQSRHTADGFWALLEQFLSVPVRPASHRSRAGWTVAGCFGVLLIGALDYATGQQIAFSIFYLLPICIATWHAGLRNALFVSSLGASTWLAADLAGQGTPAAPLILLWNAFTRLTIFATVVLLLTALRRRSVLLENEVRRQTAELTGEIAERRRAERLLAVQHEVTRRLAESVSWPDTAAECMKEICERLEWDRGLMWMSDTTSGWRLEATYDREEGRNFQKSENPLIAPKQVMASGKSIFFPDLPESPGQDFRSDLAFPILSGHTVLGVIELKSLRPRSPNEEWLVLAIGKQIGQFLENKRVEEEMINVSYCEIQRIAHELHDGVCQYLSGIAFRAKHLEQNLVDEKSDRVGDAAALVNAMNDAVGQVRNLARGLDPVDVLSSGLVVALQNLALQIRESFRIKCTFESDLSEIAMDPPSCVHLYRIAQEATTNAIRHGGARSIEIRLCKNETHLRLSIHDDGNGYTPRKASSGMGLRIMHYRARTFGGTTECRSHEGGGTEVRCLIPVVLTRPTTFSAHE